jgi:hypothetical protein
MIHSSLQRLVSVRNRAEVIIAHTPSISGKYEMHAQSVEKFIVSPALRSC